MHYTLRDKSFQMVSPLCTVIHGSLINEIKQDSAEVFLNVSSAFVGTALRCHTVTVRMWFVMLLNVIDVSRRGGCRLRPRVGRWLSLQRKYTREYWTGVRQCHSEGILECGDVGCV